LSPLPFCLTATLWHCRSAELSLPCRPVALSHCRSVALSLLCRAVAKSGGCLFPVTTRDHPLRAESSWYEHPPPPLPHIGLTDPSACASLCCSVALPFCLTVAPSRCRSAFGLSPCASPCRSALASGNGGWMGRSRRLGSSPGMGR
jgi:hypothetical protein